MLLPWEVRKRQDRGDDKPDGLFFQVGSALSAWETLESRMAELFDALVSAQPSNRAAYSAFVAVKSSSARTELLEAAAERAIKPDDPAYSDVNNIITAFGKSGARRNDIAHGRVYNLGEHGFKLGPNNIMAHKWTDEGRAKYEYCASDIEHYAKLFSAIENQCEGLVTALEARGLRKTNEANSRRDRRDKRT